MTANPKPMKTVYPERRKVRSGRRTPPEHASFDPGKNLPATLKTSPSKRHLGGPHLYSKCDPAEFIRVPCCKPHPARRPVLVTRRLCALNSPPQEALSPEIVSCGRCNSRQGMWHEAPYQWSLVPDLPNAQKASQPFRRGLRVRHHPLTRQRVATALPRAPPGLCPWLPPQASPAVYLGPTPRLQHFKHVGDHTHAPATKPAAGALPALAISFVFWVTWLSGVTPRTSGRMSGLPPRHRFGKAGYNSVLRISGGRI